MYRFKDLKDKHYKSGYNYNTQTVISASSKIEEKKEKEELRGYRSKKKTYHYFS